MYSYGHLHMDEQKQDDHWESTYSISVLIHVVTLEDLPEAMDDTEGWRERVRDIHADGTTWCKNAIEINHLGPGDQGSIPGQVLPKTQKMVLDTVLLNTQHYKVRIKGKVEQSREWSSAQPNTLVL